MNKHFTYRRFSLIAFITAALIAIPKLMIWISFANKGLEITDEGCFLIAVSSDIIYADFHMLFGFIVQGLFPFVEFTTTTSRIFAIAAEVIGILLLSIGLSSFIKKYLDNLSINNSWLIFTLIGITALFSGIGSRSTCYLHITPLLIYGALGLTLLFLSSNKKLKYIYPIIIGLFMAMLLHVKFSSALIGFLFILFTVGVYLNVKQLISFFMFTIIGFIIGQAYLFITVISPADLVAIYQESWKVIYLQGYNVFNILWNTYIKWDLVSFSYYFVFEAIAVIILFFIFKRSAKPVKWFALLIVPVTFITLIVVSLTIPLNSFDNLMFRYVEGYLFLSLLALGVLIFYNQNKQDKGIKMFFRQYWVFLVLFFAPFICMVGTAVPIQMSLVAFIAPWAILVFLAVVKIQQTHTNYISLNLGLAMLWIISFVHFSYTQFYYERLPHSTPEGLTQQTELLHNLNIKVDKPSFKFFTGIENALKKSGYKAGMPVVALTDMPGVIYYLNAYSPERAWYFGPNSTKQPQNAVDVTCYHINNLDLHEHEQAPYLLIRNDIQPDIYNCLKNSELNFPDNYTLIDSVYSPYFTVFVKVYSPTY